MAYHYSIIKFVPDPARGESMNLGLVAGDDDVGDWELRLLSNFKRARYLDPGGLLAPALGFVARLEDHINSIESIELLPDPAVPPMTVGLLSGLSTDMNNIVQLSPPAPVAAESAEAALDLLFDELIVDPAARSFRFEKKHRALRSVRWSYRTHGIPPQAIETRAQVMSGAFQDHFDFGVHDGKVVQLVQCWSFQLPNQYDLAEEIKAWAWTVKEIRQNGGALQAGETVLEVPAGDETDIVAVYIPPLPEQQSRAFEEAQAAFGETAVRGLIPEDAELVGIKAASLLHGS